MEIDKNLGLYYHKLLVKIEDYQGEKYLMTDDKILD